MTTSNKRKSKTPDRRMCVDMDIEAKKRNKRATLILNINFFTEEKEVGKLGTLEVGIQKGRLKLELVNSRMPLQKRGFLNPLSPGTTVKRTESGTSGHSEKYEGSLSAKVPTDLIKNTPSITSSAKHTSGKEHSGTSTNEFVFTEKNVTSGGFDDAPFWEFEVEPGQEVLRGGIVDERLGEVEISGAPCAVNADFVASERDLWISGSEGIWPSDMNNSNRAVRKLVIWFVLKMDRCLNHQHIEC